jgi:2-oxoglutarate ferredoxin oxidoreductase subunit alpha
LTIIAGKESMMGLHFLEGNEAIGWGALAAGCRFFAGYPITPATSLYNTMLKLLPPRGGIVLQGEDEMASIGFCLGASMAGLKAMTATSGPGLSLYSEHISFAIGSEIPLVIVDVQRLGPSTGSATKGADGDIQFIRWGNSGGQPIIALAPVDVKDCYTLTAHAFNLAEQYRCPVFIAANKEISVTRETLDLDRLALPKIKSRSIAQKGKPYLPFVSPDGSLTPDFLPIGGDRVVRHTSSTHGPDGYITTDPDQITALQERLNDKVNGAVDSFTFYEEFPEPDSDTLVITYGVTARSAKVAISEMKKRGQPVSLLILKTLWPVPEGLIQSKAKRYSRIVVFEMNMGQYVREIERLLPGSRIDFYGQMNGELFTPWEVEEVLNHD